MTGKMIAVHGGKGKLRRRTMGAVFPLARQEGTMRHETMTPVGTARARRQLSIEAALNWAFGTECASIDFTEELDPDSYRGGGSSDSVWLIMQRGRLGCSIDGSSGGGFGGSLPHADAEVIASQVASLTPSSGGRGMAVRVASLARIGARPDWMPGARPQCVPVDRTLNQHGWAAATEDARTLGAMGFPPTPRRNRKGVIVHDQVRFCPVTYAPSAAQIGAARRGYLDWWGALLEIGHQLRTLEILETIEITMAMPPLHPWRE